MRRPIRGNDSAAVLLFGTGAGIIVISSTISKAARVSKRISSIKIGRFQAKGGFYRNSTTRALLAPTGMLGARKAPQPAAEGE